MAVFIAMVLSQEEKNLREGSECFINGIMTLDDSLMTLMRIPGVSWGCVTKAIVL